MKPTGIVRKVDELGRVVIPKELRRDGTHVHLKIIVDEVEIIACKKLEGANV